MIRGWGRALCLYLALMLGVLPAAQASSISAYINANTKVYQKATTSSKSLKAAKGTSVVMTDYTASWAKVTRGGVTAYVPLKYITLKNRMTAYASQSATLYKSASKSSKKVCALAKGTELYVIGRDGDYYRVQNKSGSVTGYLPSSQVSWTKPKADSAKDKVVKMDWYKGGSGVLRRGAYAQIYVISTGQTIRIKRMGGTNHADIEPATADDTKKLLKAAGGKWSWASIPVILIAGGKYVACAINTMPHGDQTITNNNYDGQCCLHMVGSKTHGTDKVNENHQKAIQKAYDWAHK